MISVFDIDSVQKKKPPDHGGFDRFPFSEYQGFAAEVRSPDGNARLRVHGVD
jgi:hypothetical protein